MRHVTTSNSNSETLPRQFYHASITRLIFRDRGRLVSRVSLLFLVACLPMLAQQNPPAGGTAATASSADDDKSVGPHSSDELRKAVQNPVADLISVPFQNNTAFDIGPFNRTQDVLEIEPVIPVHITKKWMLINRIIQPLVWQPYPSQSTGGEYGFGDMNPEFFISPTKPGKLIWGVGPAVVIPTATNTILGQGKLSLGPGFVALTQPHHWTLGVLTNNVWSVAGSGSRPSVNQFLLQYFINYNMKKGWYIDIAPIITANREASGGNIWTVPFGGRPRKADEDRISADEYDRPILRQRGASLGSLALGHANTNRSSIPETNS